MLYNYILYNIHVWCDVDPSNTTILKANLYEMLANIICLLNGVLIATSVLFMIRIIRLCMYLKRTWIHLRGYTYIIICKTERIHIHPGTNMIEVCWVFIYTHYRSHNIQTSCFVFFISFVQFRIIYGTLAVSWHAH